MSRISLLLLLTFTTACYGSAPPRPKRIERPPVTEAFLDVRTEYRTIIENHKKEQRTCPGNVTDTKSDKCTVTYVDVAEPVTRAETTATYGANPINYAKFLVLTDSTYEEKLKALDELRERCDGANVPRWIGTGLFLGGLLVAGLANGNDAVAYSGLGVATGGMGAFAVGYYSYGGRDCHRAWETYHMVDLDAEDAMMTVIGEGRANEMKMLADQFNKEMYRASEPPAEAPLPSAGEPPVAPTAEPVAPAVAPAGPPATAPATE